MRADREPHLHRTERAALHICRDCEQPFVVPVSVLDLLPDGRCIVELACANCGSVSLGTHGDEALTALDRELDAATEALHEAAAVIELVDELERVERFAEALRDDQILPEDF